MPNSNGFTAADLLTLQNALASGALRVHFEDRMVEYRSMAELERAIQLVQGSINSQAGVQSGRQVRIFSTKGLRNCDWDY